MSDGAEDFCDLVNIMRSEPRAVQVVKPLVEESNPELLERMRSCER